MIIGYVYDKEITMVIGNKIELKLVKEFTWRLRSIKNDPDEIDTIRFLLQAAIDEVNCSSHKQNAMRFIR